MMTLKNSSCKESLLKYLVSQNRPYGVNDIVQNLHNEFNKTTIQKALEELAMENKVREKVYGKQKIYSCNQVDEEKEGSDLSVTLYELDAKIEEATMRVKALEDELKTCELELKTLEGQPTTQNAFIEKAELEKAINRLKIDIKNITDVTDVGLTREDKNELSNTRDKFSKEYRKRKNICMDILHSILENYPKKTKVLLEEIGIETDNDETN